MTCPDLEILLAEYVDGTLPAEVKSALESHLAACADCRELARDAAGAVAFMERTAAVEAPPELVTRILFEVQAAPATRGEAVAGAACLSDASSAAGWSRCCSRA